MMRPLIFALILPLTVSSCARPHQPVGIRQLTKGVSAPNASAPLERGRVLFAQKEYGLAVEAFRRAAREAPNDPAGYNGLASAYDMIGRFDLSRRYYELALAVAPDDGRIYRNMARSLEMQGKADDAKKLWAEAEWVDAGLRTRQLAADLPHDSSEQNQQQVAIETAMPAEQLQLVETAAVSDDASGRRTLSLQSGHDITVAIEEDRQRALPATTARLASSLNPGPARPKIERTGNAEVLVRVAASRPADSFRPIMGRQVTVELDTPAPRAVEKTPARGLQLVTKSASASNSKLAVLTVERPVASSGRPMLTILNASRQPGMARRLSGQLALRGWPQANIGKAEQRFSGSWLVYPASGKRAALSLQKKLPFATRILFDSRVDRVVLLVGGNASEFGKTRANKGKVA